MTSDALRPEEWRPVVGFPGYDISDQGNLRSWKPCTRHMGDPLPRLIKGSLRGHEYKRFSLMRDGKTHQRYAHSLVLEAFVGPCPRGLECRHRNGNHHDNRLDNLRWGTSAENKQDMALHGRVSRGERHGAAKLTAGLVRIIRMLRGASFSAQEIATGLHLPKGAVHAVVYDNTWSHLT